jgi:hypothetical protein
MWIPRRSSQRGKAPSFDTASTRTPPVMPAIELGCERSLQVPMPSSPHVQPRLSPLFLLRVSRPSRRVAVAISAAVVAVTPACACTRSNAHRRTSAPPHARQLGERQGRAFGPVYPCTEAVDPLAMPPRFLPRGCLSSCARAG